MTVGNEQYTESFYTGVLLKFLTEFNWAKLLIFGVSKEHIFADLSFSRTVLVYNNKEKPSCLFY